MMRGFGGRITLNMLAWVLPEWIKRLCHSQNLNQQKLICQESQRHGTLKGRPFLDGRCFVFMKRKAYFNYKCAVGNLH
jgi:hypothetical protein